MECLPEDVPLLLGLAGSPARAAEREVQEERARRLERAHVPFEGRDARRRQATGLDRPREHAAGDVALRTEREHEHEVDAHRGEVGDDPGDGLERELLVAGDRADHRDGGVGEPPYRPLRLELEQAVAGVRDVRVGLREDADRRAVRDQHVARVALAREQAVGRVLRLAEPLLVGEVRAAGRQHADRRLLERNRERRQPRWLELGQRRGRDPEDLRADTLEVVARLRRHARRASSVDSTASSRRAFPSAIAARSSPDTPAARRIASGSASPTG